MNGNSELKMNRFIAIALISTGLMMLEIVWTRIFSAEFYYAFAFLILSVSVMGLGLGGLALRFFPRLNAISRISAILSLTGALAIIGPLAAIHIGMDFSQLLSNWTMLLRLLLIILLLCGAFFTGGIAVALMFRQYHREMPRLYMSDLLGAGLGVLLAIVSMNLIGTPKTTAIAALPILITALATAASHWKKIAPAFLVIISLGLLPIANRIYNMPREERAELYYTHWDAMAKIKAFKYDENFRGFNIDNAANSPIYKFDGNWDIPDSLKPEFAIDLKYLMQSMDSCVYMALGAGGGSDVLHALKNGASEIHAVEVNSHINELLTRGHLVDFTGRIYLDPRVKVITEDGRAYVRRFQNKFDIIYSLSSNTFSALASGAFALAENYLFTTEAFRDYYIALSDRGFLSMEHQFYMPRIVSQVKDALHALGVAHPETHFAVYNLPKMRRNILLLSKQPLTEEIIQNAYRPLTQENHEDIHLLFPAEDSLKTNLINRIAENGWQSVQDSTAIDLSPCTDNRPFIAQMGLWKNFKTSGLDKIIPWEFKGFPLAKLIIIAILGILLLIVLPLNLVPYFFKQPKLSFVNWLYFFTIGLGFMMLEVVLIQRYTLFIGSSAYTVVAILVSLLFASGIGSRMAPYFKDPIPFIAIAVWIILELTVLGRITHAMDYLNMFARMMLTAILISPLGFFMGMPFPKGAMYAKDLIDWGFAVNGAASVLGSVSIILISFIYGFNASFCLCAMVYLLAMGLSWLQRKGEL